MEDHTYNPHHGQFSLILSEIIFFQAKQSFQAKLLYILVSINLLIQARMWTKNIIENTKSAIQINCMWHGKSMIKNRI